MRKIIFLDIDGVLNTRRTHERKEVETSTDRWGIAFDQEAVSNLAEIIAETGAEIVISSSWKFWGLSELQSLWIEKGMPGKVVDITPNGISDEMLLSVNLDEMDSFTGKGFEIKEWLSFHGKQISHYAIIDDEDCVLPDQRKHLVLTDPDIGISKEDVGKAIAILM